VYPQQAVLSGPFCLKQRADLFAYPVGCYICVPYPYISELSETYIVQAANKAAAQDLDGGNIASRGVYV
jgi:hypothetical protein